MLLADTGPIKLSKTKWKDKTSQTHHARTCSHTHTQVYWRDTDELTEVQGKQSHGKEEKVGRFGEWGLRTFV